MPDRSRIPRKIKGFAPYIGITTTYLQNGAPTNAIRLGILPAELQKWIDLAAEWEPLYLLYSDKKNSRTTAIKDQLLQVIATLVELDRTNRLLDRIAASPNVTVADLSTFNIKRGMLQKTTRTVATTPISEQVVAAVIPIGGGSVSIKCRCISSKTCSIATGADSVQLAWAVGNTPPSSPDDILVTRDLSSKAIVNLQLGAGNSAQHLYIYFRWYNTRHPNLSGPWGTLQTILIY